MRKLAKEIALTGLAYGAGIVLVASIPLWFLIIGRGDMAKQVNAGDLKSPDRKVLGVRFPLSLQNIQENVMKPGDLVKNNHGAIGIPKGSLALVMRELEPFDKHGDPHRLLEVKFIHSEGSGLHHSIDL